MSRIDPLRGRLGRRDLLKMTGAAAGVAALGDLTGRGVLPARSALARQDAANAIIFGVGTDVDELDPRTTDTQEGYIACANIYDCLVLYDLGATTIRPGLAESWEISDDGLVYTFNLARASNSMTARRSTPTPSSPGTTRSMRARPAPSTMRPAWSTWRTSSRTGSTPSKRSTSPRSA